MPLLTYRLLHWIPAPMKGARVDGGSNSPLVVLSLYSTGSKLG